MTLIMRRKLKKRKLSFLLLFFQTSNYNYCEETTYVSLVWTVFSSVSSRHKPHHLGLSLFPLYPSQCKCGWIEANYFLTFALLWHTSPSYTGQYWSLEMTMNLLLYTLKTGSGFKHMQQALNGQVKYVQ